MQYKLEFGIAAAIFLAIYYIFLTVQYTTENRENRLFRNIVLGVFAANALDIISAVTFSYSEIVPMWINYIFHVSACIVSVFCAYILPAYVRYKIYPDTAKKDTGDLINAILFAISVVVAVGTPITHSIIYFDSNGVAQRPLIPYIAVFYLYFISYTVVKMIVKRKYFVRKQFWAIMMFAIISCAGVLIQAYIMPDVLITFFAVSIGSFVAIFALETPDYVMLEKTMEELNESKALLEKANERALERTRTAHQLMRTASWVLYFDENGNVSDGDWSDEFLWMLGYDKEEVKDEVYDIWSKSLHPEDHADAMKAFMDGMFGKNSFNMEYRLANKTGEYRWYRGTGELKLDGEGKPTSYQGVIQDIDNEKQNEILNKEKIAALEELEKSEAALKEALKAAESANEAKSRFLSNMSHDIRTPMNAIVGFTDLALGNIDDTKAVEDYLNKIQISGNHLLSLINDILDMSRIESGKVVLEDNPAEISTLISDIDSMVSGEAKNHGLTFVSEVSDIIHEHVFCDKLRLRQVLINCLGNSIKFTPEGGSVSIRVKEIPYEAVKTGDDVFEDMPIMGRYVFTISDTGIGMTKEFLKHIFEPFEREKTSTISKTQGTGLGMSITKNIIDMMGGTIEIESELGAGTTFTITVPFKINTDYENTADDFENASDAEAVMSEKTKKDVTVEEKIEFLNGKHFLLVDDNSTNRLVARGLLKSKNMTVEEAENGDMAISRLREAKAGEFDAVLMDIQMPVMSGYEAADIIRGFLDEEISKIPILAMTANAFEEDKRACLEHGMNGHIAKPFKIDDLVDKLYEILS